MLVSVLGVLVSSLIIVAILGLRGFFVKKEMRIANFSEVAADNLDSDGDGLLDHEEKRIGTNPYLKDTDGDGIDDGEEIRLGLDPLKPDNLKHLDIDGDGLTGEEEERYGTNPFLADSDFDGYSDGDEIASGNDPLKANLSGYLSLNAIANSADEIDGDGSEEVVIDITDRDMEQIAYLENALSADNIYDFKDNFVGYIGSYGETEKVSGELVLPEISDADINISDGSSREAKKTYANNLENIIVKNISVFDSSSSSNLSLDGQNLGLIAEFALFIQNMTYQIKEIEVPKDEELIKLHKGLLAGLMRSDNLLSEIIKKSNRSDEKSTIDVMNGFNELTTIMNNIIFDQILTKIAQVTA